METNQKQINTLLGELKTTLQQADAIVEKLTKLGHDFNRKDGDWDFAMDPKNIRGQLMEVILSQLMTNDVHITFEAKSEQPHSWIKSGNMFVECQKQLSNGTWVNSGIRITKAHWWAHILKDGDGQPFSIIMMPVKTLLDRIELLACRMVTESNVRVDGNSTYGYLVPIREVIHRKGDWKIFQIDQEIKNK